LVAGAIAWAAGQGSKGRSWHTMIEGRPMVFTFLVLLAMLAGGVAELVPSIVIRHEIPLRTADAAEDPDAVAPEESEWAQQPYSPLELEGRDLYIREGCYNCHSQMIRPFRHETLRFGAYSRAEEFRYDHPFQWGSRRMGPDLHRVGGRYPNLWHYEHMRDPRSTSPGSNMPTYGFLVDRTVDYARTRQKMGAMRTLGVPYSDTDLDFAEETARSQAGMIAADLHASGARIAEDSELIALIGYLQRLGRGPQPTGPERN
ncbi:cytochrome-c oxidase, cbb3-type subunit II, partial [bacterium]|nr:cytochrome-c oxidase, cbb3-type subunit II [bacterium]